MDGKAREHSQITGRRNVGLHRIPLRPLMRPNKPEARGRKRVTKVLPVDCVVQSLPLNRSSVHYLGPGDTFGGRTVNLSLSGLQIHSDIELDPMTVLDVAVNLDRPPRRFVVRTQVAWAKRNAFDIYGRWRMGLRIIESRPGELEALSTYFHQLQAE